MADINIPTESKEMPLHLFSKAPEVKEKKKRVRELHVRRAKNGYIARHEMEEGEPSEEHIIPDQQALVQHISDHMADQGE